MENLITADLHTTAARLDVTPTQLRALLDSLLPVDGTASRRLARYYWVRSFVYPCRKA
jgi:hypothetical protein